MKKKVMALNLANMTENDLIKLIKDNNMEQAELFAILESMFEMFSCSLKFSSVVFDYGHKNFPEFVPTFLQHAMDSHGISAQRMVDILGGMSSPVSPSVH